MGIAEIALFLYGLIFLVFASIFFLILFIILHVFRSNESKLGAFIPLFLFFVFMTLWNFFGIMGNYNTPSRTPPLGDYIPPAYYNIISLTVLPILISFIVIFIILRSAKFKHAFLATLILLVFVLPFRQIGLLAAKNKYPDYTSQQVSLKEMEAFGKSISAQVLGEEIIYDQKWQTKRLIIKTKINVPKDGRYGVDWHTILSYPKGRKFNYDTNTKVFGFNIRVGSNKAVEVNGKQLIYLDITDSGQEGGIYLQTGENDINFDFPIIYGEKILGTPIGKDEWEARLNPFFVDGINGTFGPYNFKLNINSYMTEKGLLRFNYSSPEYLTKTYSFEDFNSPIPKW